MSNPYAGTIWADKNWRQILFSEITKACATPVTFRGARPMSWSTQQANKNHAVDWCHKKLAEATEAAVLAERRRCMTVAMKFSKRAAAAIEKDELPKIEALR